MRILLIRSEDGLLDGPWAESKWDRVVDLGRGGIRSYSEASSRLGSSISFLDQFRDEYSEIRRTRELLALGKHRVVDSCGLDWWVLNSILVHQQLETIILLQKLASTISAHDEVWISGPGLHAQALAVLMGRQVRAFSVRRQSKGLGYYLKTLRKFPLGQSVEILWDKTDASYEFRSRFTSRPKPQKGEVVLLPSAYGNVSRMGTAYAASVPDVNFLLVATRRSGWLAHFPNNVCGAWLVSYASPRSRQSRAEYLHLKDQWNTLRKELENVPEFKTLSETNCFDSINYYFFHGLGIRDAWRQVLESEPISAVLCADDTNPFTHMPLLLAKERGLPTIFCHHGALDGRCMVKECHADVVLAKGKMEKDYLTRLCAMPAERVQIGAPVSAPRKRESRSPNQERPFVIFFSEPYETTGGRAADAYADLLPALARLAAQEGKRLIIKLHPAESLRERRSIVERFLASEQIRNVQFITEPLTPELLDMAWFGITVLSTVVIECSLQGVPCFLCKWLESSPYGYIDQFVRFELGVPLSHPDEIAGIPHRLHASAQNVSKKDYWEEASGTFLKRLLSGAPEINAATAVQAEVKSSV